MTLPTAAQLKAANLVAETPPLVNGKPIRSYDSVHKNFPPIETVYVTPAVVTPPPPPPPPATGLELGINAGGIQWVTASDPSNAKSFAMLKELGAKYVRIAIPWNYLDRGGPWGSFFNADGSYNTESASQVNAITTIAASYGLTVLFCIDGCIGTGTFPTGGQYNAGYPITPQAFAAACAWMAKQCPGQRWELINEPDQYQYGSGAQLQMTPATYTEAVKLAYPAMKAADPTCVVHMGPVANIGCGSGGYNFLQGCYEAGIVGFFDVLSFHCYSWPGGGTYLTTENGAPLDQQITDCLIPLQKQYGDKSPLWLTETGWLSGGTGCTPDMTPALQSQYLVQWLERLQQLPVAVVMQYCLLDWTATGGLWGLADVNGNQKPSFAAVQELFA